MDEVTLHLAVRGAGRISLYRSNAAGQPIYLTSQRAETPDSWTPIAFPVSLAPFEDGGWIWFDVFTTDTTLRITGAEWRTDRDIPIHQLAVGMTTMRPDDCVTALEALGEDPAVLAVIDKIFVVDQGARKVRDNDRYPAAAKQLGDHLDLIEQDNLGGSGGFARVMHEAITGTDADSVTLMDDDIVLEPESLLRAATFAGAAAHPTIVGSHMFDLNTRARLLATAEVVDLSTCLWRTAPDSVRNHNFTTATLRETPALHRRVDAGYNGWWTCTIPRTIITTIGLPLPLFIKWDDAEHCIRAAAHGFPTVSLPGSAIWHMPWTDKNDTSDWQAYFHVRNRLITAALHSEPAIRTALVASLSRAMMKHLLAMQYSTAELTQCAIEDFLTGPQHLFDSLRTALPEIQRDRGRYLDTQVLPHTEIPHTPTHAPAAPPRSPAHALLRATRALAHNLRPANTDTARPDISVAAHDAHWSTLGLVDNAIVSTAAGLTRRHRDPAIFRGLLTRATLNHRRLHAEWRRTADRYRRALDELTSLDAWHPTLYRYR